MAIKKAKTTRISLVLPDDMLEIIKTNSKLSECSLSSEIRYELWTYNKDLLPKDYLTNNR